MGLKGLLSIYVIYLGIIVLASFKCNASLILRLANHGNSGICNVSHSAFTAGYAFALFSISCFISRRLFGIAAILNVLRLGTARFLVHTLIAIHFK